MLSEKLIQEIEKSMGLSGLKESWESEEVVELEPTKVKHFTEAEHRQLIINVQNDVPKEKWEDGKKAGHEMAVKALRDKIRIEKGDDSFDFGGKHVEHVYEHMKKQIELSKETDSTKIKAEYEADLNQLKSLIKSKDDEILNIQKNVKRNSIDSKIDSYFSTLQIQAPANLKDEKQIQDYIKLEREKNKNYFKSQYEFDIDEYDNIVSSQNGQILKDDTLNPIRVDNLIKDYAEKSFMSLKQGVQGRGEGDRFPGREMTRFKDAKEAMEWYNTEKGVKYGTSEMDAIQAEFTKK